MISLFIVAALGAPTPPGAPAPASQGPGSAAPALEPVDARALRSVRNMSRARLKAARAAGMPTQVIAVFVGDGPLAERLLAARALARLGTQPGIDALAAAVQRFETPEEVALARESAKALRQLHAKAALLPALSSPDPEVRAAAAASGVDKDAICALLAKDAWPMVRIAAAQGLAGTSAACLATGLADAEERVAIASARAAIDAPHPALRPALRRLAASPKAATEARAHAFVALAALDDLEPAVAAMKTHLSTGEIVPLAEAAVRAFAVKTDVPRLTAALRSASPRIVRGAARALLVHGSPDARAAVDAAIQGADPRLANVLRRMAIELAPLPVDGDDPAANDPE